MTCQEVRFIPVRFEDGYGPVGAWFLLFKSRATNSAGGDYMVERKPELEKWGPYGRVKPIPANLRNYLGMLDILEGKGPIYMRTEEALTKIAEQYKDDPKAYQKKVKELESEAWEDFLDMTISQAILWAATNVAPEKRSSEIAAAEPYFIGSHSGASGAWVSGPEDLQTADTKGQYFWGYANMSTVKGLFCAGDASGASSHKFSSGSHAEGRIAAKAAIKFIVDNNALPKTDQAVVDSAICAENSATPRGPSSSRNPSSPPTRRSTPSYIKPRMFMFRLQKIMDEYPGGVTAQFSTNKAQLERALELLAFLKEDSTKPAASNLHELMRCWENVHRMWQAEAHVRTVLFRQETRWPGYYMRANIRPWTKKSGTSSPIAGAIPRPENGTSLPAPFCPSSNRPRPSLRAPDRDWKPNPRPRPPAGPPSLPQGRFMNPIEQRCPHCRQSLTRWRIPQMVCWSGEYQWVLLQRRLSVFRQWLGVDAEPVQCERLLSLPPRSRYPRPRSAARLVPRHSQGQHYHPRGNEPCPRPTRRMKKFYKVSPGWGWTIASSFSAAPRSNALTSAAAMYRSS